MPLLRPLSTTSISATSQSEFATSPPQNSGQLSMSDGCEAADTPSSRYSRPRNPLQHPPPESPYTPFSFLASANCWPDAATQTLIEAWGFHYRRLNGGNLRRKQWQEVADAVNVVHGTTAKLHCSDIECKERIDTLMSKYEFEKARVSRSGRYNRTWPFFESLNSLIASIHKSPTPPPHASAVPVAPRLKCPADKPFSRPNFSSMMGEAAASETSRTRLAAAAARSRRDVAEALRSFGEVYNRVELAKNREMLELAKQRMKFAKEMEIESLNFFLQSQIRISKIKRAKR